MRHPFCYLSALQAKTVLRRAQRGAPARLQGIFHSTKRPVGNRHGRQRRAATAARKGGGANRGGEGSRKLATQIPPTKSTSHTTITGGTCKGDRGDTEGWVTSAAATVRQHGAPRLRRDDSHHRTNAARDSQRRRKHEEHEHEGRTRGRKGIRHRSASERRHYRSRPMGRTTTTRRTLPSHSAKNVGTDAHNRINESSLF